MIRPAPALRAAAADSEPLLPAAPMIATTGPLGAARAHHPVGQRRRAAHVHDRQGKLGGHVAGQPGRDRPAEQDRVAVARHLLGLAVPARQPVGDHQRGQAERDQGGDLVARPAGRAASPGRPRRPRRSACRRSRSPGSASCRASLTISSTAALILSGSPPFASCSWRNEAASRLSRCNRTRTSSGQIAGRGVEPPGCLRQHAGRLEHPVQAERRAGAAGLPGR